MFCKLEANIVTNIDFDYSGSCAISDITATSITITGGWHEGSRTKVSQYNIEGWVRDLPQLQQGRWEHGCGHFLNDDNNKVIQY